MSMSSFKNNSEFFKNDSVEDLRAAFICITNSLTGYFKTPEELTRALQGCGRNPNAKKIETYWNSFKKIGIDEFCEIANKEEAITEKQLVDAFRSLDTNKNGYITAKEFINLLTNTGDQLSQQEARKILHEADLNNDGKINYKEFSNLVIDTVEKAKKVARKKMKKIMSQREFEKNYFTKDRNSSLSLRSHKSNVDFDNYERPLRKSNSRLSFADEKEKDRHANNPLKDMLKNEVSLTRVRSSDSLKTSKPRSRNGQYSEGSDEETLSRNRKLKENFDHHHHQNQSFESERSRDHYRNSSKDLDRTRDSIQKKSKLSTAFPIFETKHQALKNVQETFQEPKNLKKWPTKTTRGAFYFNEVVNGIISNSFALDLHVETSVFLSIEAFTTNLHISNEFSEMDVSLLIVKDSKNLTLKGLTEFKIKNKYCTRLDLKPGRYFLFPFTSGCHLKKRIADNSSNNTPRYFQKDLNNKKTLSRQFRDALAVVFEMCDLDSNGRLSQEELNLYTFLTANETLSNEEWKFVGETVGFEKGELTKNAFIQLSIIEAQRDDTDIEDISLRIGNMGFNKSLLIDQSCPYKINVSCETDQFDLLIGEIFKLKSAEQFLCQLIEAKGVVKKIIKGENNLFGIEYHNSFLSVIEIQNQTNHEVLVEIDSSQSENCLSNVRSMNNIIKLKPNKNKIAMLQTPKNHAKDWECRYTFGLEQSLSSRRTEEKRLID